MGRRKDVFAEEYDSDTDSSEDDDDLLIPGEDGDETGFGHRNKRRRTNRNTKERQALGVFASDSEDDEGPRWKSKKNLRRKGMGFVSAGANLDDEDDEDPELRRRLEEAGKEEENRAEEEEEEEEYRPTLGLGAARTAPSFAKASGDVSGDNDQMADGSDRPRIGLAKHAYSRFKPAGGSPGGSGASTPHFGLGFNAGGSTPTGSGANTPSAAPSFSTPFGQGFVSSAAKMEAAMPKPLATPPPNGETPVVRPSAFAPAPSTGRKGKKAEPGTPQPDPNSFAARMMAKMGYKPGQGLGKEGQGRLEPVAPKVRPQGVGIGAVKEMSEQEKREARRAAALRGEVVSDSESEKERKRRKAKKLGGTPGGGATPRERRQKTKFRTAEEIAAEAKGLEVPNAFKSIIDLTGREQKLLTSASGLLLQPEKKEETEQMKLARMARKDLEAFADEWKGMQERKAFLDHEETRLDKLLQEHKEEVDHIEKMVDLSKQLQNTNVREPRGSQTITAVVEQLEKVQNDFESEIATFDLSALAVAAIFPHFQSDIASWDPLTDPFFYRDHFNRLRKILQIRDRSDLEREYSQTGTITRGKTASPYESMISTLFLPRVRAILNNSWNPHDSTPALTLFEVWSTVLPPYIISNLQLQVVLPKLCTAVTAWNPRVKKRSPPPPHEWIFPWLPYLHDHMSDLLSTLHHKLMVLLDTWDLANPLPGLADWREVLGADKFDRLLIRHLLPRLALHLRTHFTVNPADQDLEPLETVLAWTPVLPPTAGARLLVAEFFPQWLTILHTWLTAQPNLMEVQEWYSFWKDIIPPELLATDEVQAEFNKGLHMMNQALELGARAAKELPAPAVNRVALDTAATPRKEKREERKEERSRRQEKREEAVSFRDVVEEYCNSRDLLVMPLRRAHEATGEPLWRVTESAAGTGGVVCYFRGDVVWARGKGGVFEPVGVEELAERALGGGK